MMTGVEKVIKDRQQMMMNGIYDCKAEIIKQLSPTASMSPPVIHTALRTDFSQVEKSNIDEAWNQLIPELSQTNSQVNLLISKVTGLERQWSQFDKWIREIFVKLNDQKQYIQSWNLLIHNLTNVPTEKRGAEFSDWIVGKLNELLPSLNGSLRSDQIDRSHIFRKENKKKKSVVIIRFISRDIRNNVLKCRRDLKKSGIVITEHLTKPTLDLLEIAKERVGYKNTWTYEGKIYISHNTRKIQINSVSDLPPLVVYHPMQTYASQVANSSTSSSDNQPSAPTGEQG